MARKRNRKKNRLSGYDYSNCGMYFITICTWKHIEWFGRVENGKMVLNKYGEITEKIWTKISIHFENITLDQYVIMPNHIHGIIVINDYVGNRHACSLHRQYHLIPVIVGSYKSAASRMLRQIENGNWFRWQKSFHDHIIRNDASLRGVRQYIQDNPVNWEDDCENLSRK